MTFIARLKREISKHPAKAGVLGVLVVVMVLFSVKAVFELSPRGAAAAAISPAAEKAARPEIAPPPQAVSESMQESSMLWGKLKEVKSGGVAPEWAFRFDSSFYGTPVQDLNRRPAAPDPQENAKPAPPAETMESDAERTKRIMEESQKLSVKSTAVGNGTVQPLAIVNNQMLTVGNTINGFEIVAIRSREVQFRKEGVLLTRKMLDDPRGQ